MESANIFSIQRYSLQDGPGIRTTVFFKGCPLRCHWCSNPESQVASRQLAHTDGLCNGCKRCEDACPRAAIRIEDRTITVDREQCDCCGRCVPVCAQGALKLFGGKMPVGDILREVLHDAVFYRNSDGGITASGGEPLAQPGPLVELFGLARQAGIHTCLDTTGHAAPESLREVLQYTDLVYYDLKHMDHAAHRQLTGVGNDLILRNLSLTAGLGVPVVIRVPLVPGMNDTGSNLEQTAAFVSRLDRGSSVEVHILPYHRFGAGKYAMLDMKYPMGDMASLTAQSAVALGAREIFGRAGIKCRIEA